MFKEVIVKVKVPDNDFCFCDADDTGGFPSCQFLKKKKIDDTWKYYCYLYKKEVRLPHKLEECKKLDSTRICINCGEFGSNWCELHKKEVLTSDTCEDFVYGSWK